MIDFEVRITRLDRMFAIHPTLDAAARSTSLSAAG